MIPTSQNPGVSGKCCGSVESIDEPWRVWAYNTSSQVSGNPSPKRRQRGTGSFRTTQCRHSHSLVRCEDLTFIPVSQTRTHPPRSWSLDLVTCSEVTETWSWGQSSALEMLGSGSSGLQVGRVAGHLHTAPVLSQLTCGFLVPFSM